MDAPRRPRPDAPASGRSEPIARQDPARARGLVGKSRLFHLRSDRATSYFPRFAGDPRYGPDLMRPLDYSCYAGSSVFVSTPSDLVRFAMAINSGQLLQPATVQLLQTSQRQASGQETGYGLGWDLETVALAGQPTRWVGHDGQLLGGMAASLMMFPEHGIVVSVLSNTSYADTEALGLSIAQAFAALGNSPARK